MKVNHLHLMVPDVPAARAGRTYPENFHVGFFLESESKVDAIHERMTADGIEVAAPQRTHAYPFNVKAPGDFLVEIGA